MPAPGGSVLEPLRSRHFRHIWLSGLLSNFGWLILSVGAAWEMTRLAGDPDMVALVQSAATLPLMLVLVPAGALADMFDRRLVALAGLGFTLLSSLALFLLSAAGLLSPWLLLFCIVLIGLGAGLYLPAWQAALREKIEPRLLPAAVSLQSISFNIARSFGPALGGVIVLLVGATATFGINVVSYIPLIVAFALWRRPPVTSRLPPERLDRAVMSGARHVFNSPSIRALLIRGMATSGAAAALLALPPVIARDLLQGGAATYGLLLGFFGLGAVAGAPFVTGATTRFGQEGAVRVAALLFAAMAALTGLSHHLLLTCVVMFLAGSGWMVLTSLLNLSVQLSAPRWVTARALSWYQSAFFGGIAAGSWLWGKLASLIGVGGTMVCSGAAIVLTIAIGLVRPLPRPSSADLEQIELSHEPEVGLALTARSGPVTIEVDYQVPMEEARAYYQLMMKVQQARQRNGAYGWSLARNIADPTRWTERYHYPTWGDYLRQRNRTTVADRALHDAVDAYRLPGGPAQVRRLLERPFGSVRWREDVTVPSADAPVYTP